MFRNVVVHQYEEVDAEIVAAILKKPPTGPQTRLLCFKLCRHGLLRIDFSGVFWFFPITQFCPDRTGVSSTMKETKHYYLLVLYHEINGVRKSSQQTAAEFIVDLWVMQWVP